MLSDTLIYKFQIISWRLHDAGKRDFSPLGITRVNFVLLCLIHEYPGLTQSELAEKCAKDRNVICKTIDKLEAKGFVKRVRGQKDRRVFTLHTTPEGEQAIAEYWGSFATGDEDLFKMLTPQQKQALGEILDILYQQL